MKVGRKIGEGWRWGRKYGFMGEWVVLVEELGDGRGVSDEEKRGWGGEGKLVVG